MEAIKANQLMSGMLKEVIKTQLNNAVSSGDTALANAMKKKTVEDCHSALFQAFFKIASDARNSSNAVGMNGSDELIGSAAIHWFTEDNPTTDSLIDILKGGTEVMAMKADKPKAETKPTPKAAPVKPTTPKAALMKVATSKATIPTATPTPTAPTSTPAFRVIADDEDFDVD